MDAATIESVRREEAELSRKLAAVRSLLAAYGEQPSSALPSATQASPASDRITTPPAVPAAERAQTTAPGKRSIDDFTPYGREAIATSMSFLIGQNAPVKTRELVELVEGIGFTIRGENAMNALGALLGRSVDVVSHGKTGWTLSDPERAIEIVGKYARKENEPPSVSADGSDAAGEGASPPNPASIHSNWGQDA